MKVCELEDLPPGKGKIVQLGGFEIRLFNREGRVFALREERTAASPSARHLPPGEGGAACRHAGSHFEVEQEDSPARIRAHAASIPVELREDGSYLPLDELEHTSPIAEPAPY